MPSLPDRKGHFGVFGGRYVAETIMPALTELEAAYRASRKDKAFREEFHYYLRQYSGRETPLYLAKNLTEKLGGAKIYLKREDLNHTGSHKINNTLGQALLARRMGKRRRHRRDRAPASTAWPRPPWRRSSGWSAGSSWARRTSAARRPTCFRMKILGAEVGACHRRDGYPQGRHERGHAPLGDPGPRHLLHHRLRRRAPTPTR